MTSFACNKQNWFFKRFYYCPIVLIVSKQNFLQLVGILAYLSKVVFLECRISRPVC